MFSRLLCCDHHRSYFDALGFVIFLSGPSVVVFLARLQFVKLYGWKVVYWLSKTLPPSQSEFWRIRKAQTAVIIDDEIFVRRSRTAEQKRVALGSSAFALKLQIQKARKMYNFGFHNLPRNSVSSRAKKFHLHSRYVNIYSPRLSRLSLGAFPSLPLNSTSSNLNLTNWAHQDGWEEAKKSKYSENKRLIRCKCACSERQTVTDLSVRRFSHRLNQLGRRQESWNCCRERKQSNKNFSFIVFAYQSQFRFSTVSLRVDAWCVSSSTLNCTLLVVNLVITHTD